MNDSANNNTDIASEFQASDLSLLCMLQQHLAMHSPNTDVDKVAWDENLVALF